MSELPPTSMSVCDQFQEWAREAVDDWDGVSNGGLFELIRNKFGQTKHQFYGTGEDTQGAKELAALREFNTARNDELKTVLGQLDGLAELWGDEGVFRRCRDRLRALILG